MRLDYWIITMHSFDIDTPNLQYFTDHEHCQRLHTPTPYMSNMIHTHIGINTVFILTSSTTCLLRLNDMAYRTAMSVPIGHTCMMMSSNLISRSSRCTPSSARMSRSSRSSKISYNTTRTDNDSTMSRQIIES